MIHYRKPNCLSLWYPLLKGLDIKTPRTIIIKTDCDLIDLADGIEPHGFKHFIMGLTHAIDMIGSPCFLRTGMTSSKHNWNNSCYLGSTEDIETHVYELVEFSAMADIIGLPSDVWVVREFLELDYSFKAFRGDMPIATEFRFFVKDGNVQCYHPYWPIEVIADWDTHVGEVNHMRPKYFKSLPLNWISKLKKQHLLSDSDEKYLKEKSLEVAKKFKGIHGGYWSVDFAKTKNGDWYLIDMALGEQSYHWESCKYNSQP